MYPSIQSRVSAVLYLNSIQPLKGFPLLFALRHKRLGILFPKQSVKLFSQTFSIQCHSPILWNYPERMAFCVDPFSFHWVTGFNGLRL